MKNPHKNPWSIFLLAVGSHQLMQVVSALLICSLGLLRFQLPQLAYYLEPIAGSPHHWWQTVSKIASNLLQMVL